MKEFLMAIRKKCVEALIFLVLTAMVHFLSEDQCRAHTLSEARTRLEPEAEQVSELALGKSIERELKADETHVYQIALQSGQFAHVVVDQDGIDVMVSVASPDGTEIVDMDAPNGVYGPEIVSLVARKFGEYRFEIKPVDRTAPPGRYGIRITELRQASAIDEKRMDAQNAFIEASRLYRQATPESAGAAISRFTDAAKLFESSGGRFEQAEAVDFIGQAYFAIGKNPEAIESFHQAVFLFKDLGESLLEVLAQENLVVVYTAQARFSEAEEIARPSLQILEKVLKPNNPNLAIGLNNLAEVYRGEGKYAEAEALYVRALPIYRKLYGENSPNTAIFLNNLGLTYQAQGKFSTAEPLFKRVLEISEGSNSNSFQTAVALTNLASLYIDEESYAAAEPPLARAFAIFEKLVGPEHIYTTGAMSRLAAAYQGEAKYSDAERVSQRVLDIREKTLGLEHEYVVTALADLSQLYKTEGKYAAAEASAQRALRIAEKIVPRYAFLGTLISTLGTIYDDEGHYAQAEPQYERALAVYEKDLGPRHRNVAVVLNNLAKLYVREGKYSKAESNFTRSLDIVKQAFGPENPHVASVTGNLAALYQIQHKYSDAESLYRQALRIEESAFGPDHPRVAALLNNLGRLQQEQGKYGEAEQSFRRALAINQKHWGNEHPSVAQSFAYLAGLYRVEGKDSEAEPLFQRSLEIFERVLGPEHPDVGETLFNFATLYYEWGLPEKAAPFFFKALENLRNQFEEHFTYMSERERLSFLDTVANRFPIFFSFCFKYGDRHPALVEKMYDVLLWKKGLVVSSMVSQRARISTSGGAEASGLLEELAGKKDQLSKLLAVLRTQRVEVRETVAKLEEETNDLERRLVKLSPALASEKQLANVTWRDVTKTLKPEEAAVEVAQFPFTDGKLVTGPSYYVALVVHSKSRAPSLVFLGESSKLEGEPLQKYLGAVIIRSSGELGPEIHPPLRETTPAYEAFWKPLEPALGPAKRVYVSLDGVWNEVSLGILRADDGRLLMEKYDLRLVSSTKDLLRPLHTSSSRTAVLVGNPRFDLSEAEQRTAVETLKSAEEPQQAVAAAEESVWRSRDETGHALKPLPGTEAEVALVAQVLSQAGWQTEAFTKERALEEAVKSVRSPRVLHMATHGFFEPDQEHQRRETLDDLDSSLEDPMLRSGLYLAGANRVLQGQPPVAGVEDGELTAYEATALNLQGTDLVVLSACKTGLGELKNGEGVFGLRRALQEAGAESVLMSLWSVPDEETQNLMTRFYKKWLSGMDRAEALQKAQLEVRQEVRKHYGADLPYYWGAFILVGR
jgi:CHAT domain-containing protein/tetratricopeptide (TPR) repeat protein